MSYRSVVAMAGSISLRDRVTAALAALGLEDPLTYCKLNIWQIITHDPVWATAWDHALRQSDNPKWNPDTGERDDVITDEMITASCSARIQQNPPQVA